MTFEMDPSAGEAIEAHVRDRLLELYQEAVDVTSRARLENRLDDHSIVPFLRAQLEERGVRNVDDQGLVATAAQIAQGLAVIITLPADRGRLDPDEA